MRFYRCLIPVGLIIAASCNDKKEQNREALQQNKDNYIVLLDVSERILSNSRQQVPKDIVVIKSIYGIFKTKLGIKDTTHQYYNLNDKLKLLAAPNWFYASIDLSSEDPGKRASMASKKTENTFNELLPEIYKEAVTDNNRYAGSDIRVYFDKYLANDLEKDAQNTLFIVTDGYMNPRKTENLPAQKNRYASSAQVIDALKNDPDWEAKFKKEDYGLLPVDKTFNNLRVIVLQLDPRPGWSGEYNLLTKIWSKWLTEMGITNYSFVKNDNVQEVIGSLSKLTGTQPTDIISPEQLTMGISDSAQLGTLPDMKNIDSAKTKPIVANTPAQQTASAASPVDKKNNDAPLKNAEVKKDPVKSVERPGSTVISSMPARKKKTVTTPAVLPPDESDAGVLNLKKTVIFPEKKLVPKDDGDILQDNGAANGFNTGIKKKNKKKTQ